MSNWNYWAVLFYVVLEMTDFLFCCTCCTWVEEHEEESPLLRDYVAAKPTEFKSVGIKAVRKSSFNISLTSLNTASPTQSRIWNFFGASKKTKNFFALKSICLSLELRRVEKETLGHPRASILFCCRLSSYSSSTFVFWWKHIFFETFFEICRASRSKFLVSWL